MHKVQLLWLCDDGAAIHAWRRHRARSLNDGAATANELRIHDALALEQEGRQRTNDAHTLPSNHDAVHHIRLGVKFFY